MQERSDTTPLLTRIILIAVMMITGASFVALLFEWMGALNTETVVPFLWLFTGLFILRVVGQILVALRPRQWLPPMHQWNFIPYPVLLPIQLVFIVCMFWIDISFTSNTGIAVESNTSDVGGFLITFSAIYALAMVIRYVIRMYRNPNQRWFGGTIPIVFHFVLASYLYTLGIVYVSR